MHKNTGNSGVALFVMLGAMLWCTTAHRSPWPPGGDSLEVGALRVALAEPRCSPRDPRRSFSGGGKWPILPTIIAVLATAAYQPFFFTGTAKTGVAVGTLVTLASAPVVSGVVGFFALGERPERVWYLSSLLAIGGCSLLTLSGDAGSVVNPVGVLFSLGAGFSYALFVLGSKYLLKEHTPDAVNGVVFSGAGLVLFPVLLMNPPLWLAEPRGLVVALHLGLIATGLAYFLFLKGLSSVPASTSVTLSMAEPLTASLLGVFLLGERMNLLGVVGVVLTFAGVALLAFGVTKKKD